MNDVLRKAIESSQLPSLPVAALQVIELVQQPDVDIDTLATCISNDAALTHRILRSANSSFYGQRGPIPTVSRALMVLGLTTTRMLALGFTLVHNLRRGERGRFDYLEFWQRNLLTAVAARGVGGYVQGVDAEEAFVAGLVQSLGVLALNEALGDDYNAVYLACGGSYERLAALEQAHWGTNHVEVGVATAGPALPASLVAAIGHSLTIAGAPDDHLELVRVAQLARLIAETFDANTEAEAFPALLERAQAWFDLRQSDIEALIVAVRSEVQAMRQLFELPTGHEEDPSSILMRAHAALVEASIRVAEDTSRLRGETEVLAVQATTDSLTGLANRRAIDVFLERHVDIAKHQTMQLSVVMFDVDHFKKVNDDYGHHVGDLALAAIAGVLTHGIRSCDLAGRLGGEEFVIVLTNTGLRAASFAGERLRQAIGRIDLRTADNERVALRASAGVVQLDPLEHKAVDDLLAAADAALYRAKREGRDRLVAA